MSPSSHSRGSNGREIVFHTVGESGLGRGASAGPVCGGQWVHASSAFCGHSVLASLRMLELCFQVRIVCWPLLRSLETVSSVSVWGLSIALGFCALKTGPLLFYVIMGYCHFISYISLRFCLEIGIGGRTGGGRGPVICGASEVGAAMGLI